MAPFSIYAFVAPAGSTVMGAPGQRVLSRIFTATVGGANGRTRANRMLLPLLHSLIGTLGLGIVNGLVDPSSFRTRYRSNFDPSATISTSSTVTVLPGNIS